MAYNLIVTPDAADDVVDACIYYESVQQGLSIRFLTELANTYKILSEHPQFFSYISTKKANCGILS